MLINTGPMDHPQFFCFFITSRVQTWFNNWARMIDCSSDPFTFFLWHIDTIVLTSFCNRAFSSSLSSSFGSLTADEQSLSKHERYRLHCVYVTTAVWKFGMRYVMIQNIPLPILLHCRTGLTTLGFSSTTTNLGLNLTARYSESKSICYIVGTAYNHLSVW